MKPIEKHPLHQKPFDPEHPYPLQAAADIISRGRDANKKR